MKLWTYIKWVFDISKYAFEKKWSLSRWRYEFNLLHKYIINKEYK